MYSITVTTPAADPPVSVADLHAHLRLNDTSEDAQLSEWIEAATDLLTNSTGYLAGTGQVLVMRSDDWITSIPRTPLTSVDLVEYLDQDGEWQTLSGWTADLYTSPPRLNLPSSLPALHPTQLPRVRITFSGGEEPKAIAKQAVKLLAAHWYARRESSTDQRLTDLPMGWESACVRLRTFWMGGN